VEDVLMGRRRFAHVAIRLLVVGFASAGALLATNNWCFVLVPAVLVALLGDFVACAVRPWVVLRLPVATAIGVAAGLALSVGPDWAFREAFGRAPPAGVRDVRIQRHYVGGPGEHVLIIEFTADPAALGALTARLPEEPEGDRVEKWRATGQGWPAAFDVFAGRQVLPAARSSWLRIRPLENPEVLDFSPVGDASGRLVLFWERSTGRCVALHVRL
jgi:hypothetical protein